MPSQIISATTQYPLGGTNPSAGSLLTFKTVGLTASCSVIPKLRKPGAGTSNLVSVPYLNVSTNATATAGTAITADGVYQITAVGPETLLDATVSSGTALIDWWIVEGLGGSGGSSGGGGGGGGAVTVADGADVALGSTTDAAVGDATGTINAHLRQVAKTLATGAIVQVLGNDNAAHYLPAGDNITRSIYVIPGNGAQSQPSMDAVARPGFQKITDGTTVVGVDAGTTSINVNIAKDSTPAATTGLPVTLTSSDLTTVVGVKAASTAAVATDPAIVVAISPNNGVTLSTGAAVKVTDGTNFQPTGDAAARAVFVKNTDGTNTGAVKAASTAAAAADPAQVVAISPNNVVKVGDGTTSLVIKAASTAAVVGDTSAVVALSPNSPLPAGSSVIGTVSGTTKDIIPTLAVTASAYAAGNCMGGKLTLTSAMRISGGTGTWQTLTITDAGNQKPLLDVLLFTSNPAGTFTDKSAFPTMSVADNALVLARISILSTDWVTFGGSAYCTKVVGAIPVTAAGSATLYAAMNVTSGTPTPTATTNLNAVFGFLCD